MKAFIITLFCIVLLAACAKKTNVQGAGNGNIKEMVESRNYVFRANTAIPARGRTIQLTSDYTLVVKKDSVIAFLPYYGRAYTAPIGQSSGGIEFTSKDFVYNANEKRNGAFEIEIIPRDTKDVQRLFLTVSRSGYGSLYVNSQNRQSITFNGLTEKILR